MTDFQSNSLTYGTFPVSAPVRVGRQQEWLERWLAGDVPDATLLEQYGFQPAQFYSATVYRVVGMPAVLAQIATVLTQEISRRRVTGPIFIFRDCLVHFYPVEDPQQTQRLKRITEEIRERLAERYPGTEVCCGVGRPVQDTEALGYSLKESYNAAKLCGRTKQETRATYFGDFSLYSLLNNLKSPEELQRFCVMWLRDLITYDEQQHSDLLVTLRVYFENNGNTARTAATLSIHRNTLAYRLNRIAEITCLDLDDADVRLNLQLALKARQLLATEMVQ